jgi:hypothetical protein
MAGSSVQGWDAFLPVVVGDEIHDVRVRPITWAAMMSAGGRIRRCGIRHDS